MKNWISGIIIGVGVILALIGQVVGLALIMVGYGEKLLNRYVEQTMVVVQEPVTEKELK